MTCILYLYSRTFITMKYVMMCNVYRCKTETKRLFTCITGYIFFYMSDLVITYTCYMYFADNFCQQKTTVSIEYMTCMTLDFLWG